MTDFNVSNKNLEMLGIVLNGDSNFLKKACVVLVYRPPSGNSSDAAVLIEEIVGKYCESMIGEILIMGDLNWDFINRETVTIIYL